MPDGVKTYQKKARSLRKPSLGEALRGGVSKVAPTNVPQIRADIQVARRVAEDMLVFQGPAVAYTSARDLAEHLMKMCDNAERLSNESDRKARESRGE